MSRPVAASGQLPLPLPPLTAFGAQDFLVTSSNSEAATRIGQWPDWGEKRALVLCGDSGLGKTHLAHIVLARAESGQMWQALSWPDNVMERPAPWGMMALENAAALAGNNSHERRLLHVLNSLTDRQGHLLLTARLPPIDWNVQLPDLRSRLLALPLARLAPPDDALLAALLLKLCRDHQLELDKAVADFLMPRLPRDGHGVVKLVASLDAASLAGKRRLTIPLTRDVLAQLGLS